MILLESGDHCDLKFKIDTLIFTKINFWKPCMPDHWPLRATKVAKSILKIQP